MRAVFSASALTLLFTSLLIITNLIITRTVNAAPVGSCEQLSRETCEKEDHFRRKRSIFEYAGRCLNDELKSSPRDVSSSSFEASYLNYIRRLEKRLLPQMSRLQRFYADVQNELVKSIESSPALSQEKKKEYRKRLLATTLLLPSDHIRLGGSGEFRKTCGELGLEENASFVVFGNGDSHVMLCPGRLAAAVQDTSSCETTVTLDLESLLYTVAHELGHSVGGNFPKFDPRAGGWKMAEDSMYDRFQQCMKGKFDTFPQKDYGEATADYWASQAMAAYFSSRNGTIVDQEMNKSIVRRSLAGLCGTRLTTRHLPGDIRIQRLILAQSAMKRVVGCGSGAKDSEATCSL